MRGCLMSVAAYSVGFFTPYSMRVRQNRPRARSHRAPRGLPSNTHLRIVPQHEPVRARLDRFAIDFHVFADQAVDHAVRKVAKARTLEDDTVLDLGIANLDV